MGMFDTIRLGEPLVCPACGHAETTLQTHHFGETLDTYRVGMIVTHCPVLTGILVETFWCSACHHADAAGRPEVYLVIWHSILAGVTWKREEAEARLASVDRLDLVGWLDQAQREAAEWRRKYHGLRDDLARWHEYQGREPAQPEGAEPDVRSALRAFFMPDEDIRKAADPLAAILDRHPPGETAEEL